ncbi:hypothetical protein AB0C96_38770 [Streptomyces sp. NPDC048506]|uniref:hypothetical protein n=1 Tax=Streptomyces sp. NPDC048506 TaxID=3155028 RepID=UPI00341F8689
MSRAASIATNLAVAVATTAVGCMVVITLAPSHPRTGSWSSAGTTTAFSAGHGGSAARAATSALGAHPARPDTARLTAPVTGRIEVTAPRDGVGLRSNGSFAVAWRNSTGEEVNIWLRADTGHGRSQRMGLVATQASARPTGEVIATLPRVPPGPHYFLEVATTGDGGVRGFSGTIAITG